jgi:hypothetical protein
MWHQPSEDIWTCEREAAVQHERCLKGVVMRNGINGEHTKGDSTTADGTSGRGLQAVGKSA